MIPLRHGVLFPAGASMLGRREVRDAVQGVGIKVLVYSCTYPGTAAAVLVRLKYCAQMEGRMLFSGSSPSSNAGLPCALDERRQQLINYLEMPCWHLGLQQDEVHQMTAFVANKPFSCGCFRIADMAYIVWPKSEAVRSCCQSGDA